MTALLNTRILASLAMIVFVGAVAASSTGAFFSDTETSTGNTFTAGSLDLKVDSEAHYNGLVCRDPDGGPVAYFWLEPVGTNPNNLPALQAQEHYNTPCASTWAQTDLGANNEKFFDLHDVKPGDEGENTISLHVLTNDAWGRFVINNVEDLDGTCTEPEQSAPDATCGTTADGDGELAENMTFYAWLDQGTTPGFQCGNPQGAATPGARCADDLEEGDNIWQCAAADVSPQDGIPEPGSFSPTIPATNCLEPLVILPGTVDNELVNNPNAPDETHNIWEALQLVDAAYCTVGNPPANGSNTDAEGDYVSCHGIADDGRLVGSATYYFGLAWFIPDTVGNIAQTDSLTANLGFDVVQWRNNPLNPTPFD